MGGESRKELLGAGGARAPTCCSPSTFCNCSTANVLPRREWTCRGAAAEIFRTPLRMACRATCREGLRAWTPACLASSSLSSVSAPAARGGHRLRDEDPPPEQSSELPLRDEPELSASDDGRRRLVRRRRFRFRLRSSWESKPQRMQHARHLTGQHRTVQRAEQAEQDESSDEVLHVRTTPAQQHTPTRTMSRLRLRAEVRLGAHCVVVAMHLHNGQRSKDLCARVGLQT